MYGGFMLDEIIMDLFSDTTKQKNSWAQNNLFSKIKDDNVYWCGS